MGAALALGDGVDLVDDHRLDRAQHLAGSGGEDQVERLRRRDQDVGRVAAHRLALLLRRVAGPQRDRDLRPDPRQRGAQVALDVVGEGLERRDVDQPGPLTRASGSRERLSIPQRKAASVFPEPVGAQISVLAPLEIAGQPPACAGVGASNDFSNHLRTGAENGSSACFALAFRSEANPLILRTGASGQTRLPGLCLPPMTSERVKLLERIYARWGAGDFSRDPDLPEDFTLIMSADIPETGTYAGREGVAGYMAQFLEPWDRLTITAQEMTERGDKVLVKVAQRGIGSASGADASQEMVNLWTFSGGAPVRMRVTLDEAAARSELERSMSQTPEPFTKTYRLAMAVCRPLAWWGRMTVEGVEAMPRSGPVLLAGNHDSYFDPLVIGMAARPRRQIRALAKSALWDVRGLGPILNGMGQVPIERAAGDADALRRGRSRSCAQGSCIGVFPEGTISVGREMRARSGFGRLRSRCPEAHLVCVAVTGVPDYARFPKRPDIHVRFFEPASGQTRPGETATEVSERLMAEIRAIAPPVDAGRDPVATRAKWEAKAEALEAKRRERAERETQAAEVE